MNVGVVFPQTEIEPDRGAIRSWAEAAAELGFHHVQIFDHVTGVDSSVQGEWLEKARRGGATRKRPYEVHDTFHRRWSCSASSPQSPTSSW